jgi:hypothetical protein
MAFDTSKGEQMTLRRWFWSVLHCAGWGIAFVYAVYHIQSGVGLLIYAGLLLSAFLLLVNTVDLVFGRWLRRGPQPQVIVPIVIDKMLVANLYQDGGRHDEWLPARRD